MKLNSYPFLLIDVLESIPPIHTVIVHFDQIMVNWPTFLSKLLTIRIEHPRKKSCKLYLHIIEL